MLATYIGIKGKVMGTYSSEMTVGSRIDEFCFYCAGLRLDGNSMKFSCNPAFFRMDSFGRSSHAPERFKNPSVSEVTIRPEGSASGIAATCAHFRKAPDNELSSWRIPWLEHIKKNVAKQVEEHEKEAAPTELYVLEFKHSRPVKGALYQIFGVQAKVLPLKRSSLSEKKNPLVIVDKSKKKVWVRAPKVPLEGFGAALGKVSGQLDFAYSTAFLRDLLKRDITSFSLETFTAGQEPAEFNQYLT